MDLRYSAGGNGAYFFSLKMQPVSRPPLPYGPWAKHRAALNENSLVIHISLVELAQLRADIVMYRSVCGNELHAWPVVLLQVGLEVREGGREVEIWHEDCKDESRTGLDIQSLAPLCKRTPCTNGNPTRFPCGFLSLLVG